MENKTVIGYHLKDNRYIHVHIWIELHFDCVYGGMNAMEYRHILCIHILFFIHTRSLIALPIQ